MAPADPSRVFCAWVDVIDDTGAAHRYRIVGSDETDAARDAISLM